MSRRSCPGAPINQSHLSGRAILCSLLSAQKMKCRCRSIFYAIYIRKISKINPSDIIQITFYLHKKIFKSCSQTWKTAKTFNWKLEKLYFYRFVSDWFGLVLLFEWIGVATRWLHRKPGNNGSQDGNIYAESGRYRKMYVPPKDNITTRALHGPTRIISHKKGRRCTWVLPRPLEHVALAGWPNCWTQWSCSTEILT